MDCCARRTPTRKPRAEIASSCRAALVAAPTATAARPTSATINSANEQPGDFGFWILDFRLRESCACVVSRNRRAGARSHCFSRALSDWAVLHAAGGNPKSKIQNPKFDCGTPLGYLAVEPTLRESASSMSVQRGVRCSVVGHTTEHLTSAISSRIPALR
jgi:hypothetical protein